MKSASSYLHQSRWFALEIWMDTISWLEVLVSSSYIRFFYIEFRGKITQFSLDTTPDGILLDKNKDLDTNKNENHPFFSVPKEHNNVNSRLQERAMLRGPLKMPIWDLHGFGLLNLGGFLVKPNTFIEHNLLFLISPLTKGPVPPEQSEEITCKFTIEVCVVELKI